MSDKIILSENNDTKDETVYNEYYIKDLKSKIRKYIETGDEKFIRALKTLLRSESEDNQS
jgi:peptide subunit release factor 1 (eRF1)